MACRSSPAGPAAAFHWVACGIGSRGSLDLPPIVSVARSLFRARPLCAARLVQRLFPVLLCVVPSVQGWVRMGQRHDDSKARAAVLFGRLHSVRRYYFPPEFSPKHLPGLSPSAIRCHQLKSSSCRRSSHSPQVGTRSVSFGLPLMAPLLPSWHWPGLGDGTTAQEPSGA